MATEEAVVVAVESVPDLPLVVAADEAAEVEQPTAKSKKAKEPKTRKPRSPPSHPPYVEMVTEAIVTWKEKNGSSQYAITKFAEEKHKNLPANFKKLLLFHLKKLVVSGKLVKVKGSFKLPATRPSVPKPVASAPAKKKPAPAKPKTVKVTWLLLELY
ncbi:histone H1-like [Camellia sinensis]|uniref:H15 domain-containing protein n=1 Tax=Camellia sinensis var. sinensis TaxID=542762 RepID=A0A4S4E2E5_CAMSN|nr:histone H1-like [Camellia sinensis]THG09346.1 hypothetical protein TEA_011261 [Camellia sinensis var. sinensis]